MNEQTSALSLRRLGPIVAGLGALVLIVGLALINQPGLRDTAELLQVGGLVIGVGGAVAYAIARRESLYGFSRTHRARYGANALILTLSVMGVVVLVNYLVQRHDIKWDLTESHSFTLSDQSRKILAGLDKPVKITGFYRSSNSTRQQTLNRLETYRDAGKGKLSFELLDPEVQPAVSMRYGVTSDAMMIVESGTARKQIIANSEDQITSAILAVTRTSKPKVYFLAGHNELDPDSFDQRTGLSNIKKRLESENFEVAKLPLASTGKVPADAAALIVAGPDSPLTAAEQAALREYIEQRQGRLLLLLPPRSSNGGARGSSGLESLLQSYGLQVDDNTVIDPDRNIEGDFTVPAFNEFTTHPITESLQKRAVFLPLARSLSLVSPPARVQATSLFQSTAGSWAETNLDANAMIRRDPDDRKGPMNMAVALAISPEGAPVASPSASPTPGAARQARILVIGNAMFASNWFSGILANGDLMLNGVAWLTESEDLLGIRPRDEADRSLALTGSQTQIVTLLSLYVMPGLMLLLGIFVWWRRR